MGDGIQFEKVNFKKARIVKKKSFLLPLSVEGKMLDFSNLFEGKKIDSHTTITNFGSDLSGYSTEAQKLILEDLDSYFTSASNKYNLNNQIANTFWGHNISLGSLKENQKIFTESQREYNKKNLQILKELERNIKTITDLIHNMRETDYTKYSKDNATLRCALDSSILKTKYKELPYSHSELNSNYPEVYGATLNSAQNMIIINHMISSLVTLLIEPGIKYKKSNFLEEAKRQEIITEAEKRIFFLKIIIQENNQEINKFIKSLSSREIDYDKTWKDYRKTILDTGKIQKFIKTEKEGYEHKQKSLRVFNSAFQESRYLLKILTSCFLLAAEKDKIISNNIVRLREAINKLDIKQFEKSIDKITSLDKAYKKEIEEINEKNIELELGHLISGKTTKVICEYQDSQTPVTEFVTIAHPSRVSLKGLIIPCELSLPKAKNREELLSITHSAYFETFPKNKHIIFDESSENNSYLIDNGAFSFYYSPNSGDDHVYWKERQEYATLIDSFILWKTDVIDVSKEDGNLILSYSKDDEGSKLTFHNFFHIIKKVKFLNLKGFIDNNESMFKIRFPKEMTINFKGAYDPSKEKQVIHKYKKYVDEITTLTGQSIIEAYTKPDHKTDIHISSGYQPSLTHFTPRISIHDADGIAKMGFGITKDYNWYYQNKKLSSLSAKKLKAIGIEKLEITVKGISRDYWIWSSKTNDPQKKHVSSENINLFSKDISFQPARTITKPASKPFHFIIEDGNKMKKVFEREVDIVRNSGPNIQQEIQIISSKKQSFSLHSFLYMYDDDGIRFLTLPISKDNKYQWKFDHQLNVKKRKFRGGHAYTVDLTKKNKMDSGFIGASQYPTYAEDVLKKISIVFSKQKTEENRKYADTYKVPVLATDYFKNVSNAVLTLHH